MPFMGPITRTVSEKIKVPLTKLEQILKKFKNIIPLIVQKRKMRRNKRKYKIGKKNLKSSVRNHLIPTLMYVIEYLYE